jgi:hypothetical protein
MRSSGGGRWLPTHLIFFFFFFEKLEIKWALQFNFNYEICVATKLKNWNTYFIPTFSIPSNIYFFSQWNTHSVNQTGP